ncbi:Streptomycin 3''-adenylyltransferase [Ensifer psoraleae]|uniref:aminoglycoside adenylyltransferase family protein n=1 Tax=Sinorhizobium psoraleae TaxID=520838 RepID=UPI0015688DA6|nr:aminoglycoside adenylyltransferase family protein [Sinorhizobium psoraleae]NRP70840.1 Streptomycin 3''-adenylyltransferase [Sinorhizobium psoraleae]
MHEASSVPFEARQALPVIRHAFGDSLVAAYLHGSSVSGGLRPDSDVDVLVVIDRPTTHAVRAELVTELMKISGRPGDNVSRPLELIVFHRADLKAAVYPARGEFVYGEWLREAFEAGEVPAPVSDPEFTLLLAQARHEARSLIGPDPAELLPIIPETDIRRAIGDALPALISSLEGDERNVLLTLARMWRTLATGQFVPKDVAAEWAMSRLPAESATLVAHAREAYLGATRDDWRPRRQEARRVAGDLSARVVAML